MRRKLHILFFLLCALPGAVLAQLSGYYTQSFDGTTFPPAGWSRVSSQGAKQWERSTTEAHSGPASAFIGYQSTGGLDWLIMPQFTVASGDSLVFWMKLDFQGYAPDSLAVKVSTTGNSTTDFTNTILLLQEGVNYPPDDDFWYRYSIPLTAYAGQNIYVAFKHYNLDGDGLFIDDVAIGSLPAAEVEPVSINISNPAVSGVSTTPTVTVMNNGSAAQTFNVILYTTGYSNTQTVTNLAPGASQQVSFSPWTGSTGTYTFTAATLLAGDADTSNDTITTMVSVLDSLPNTSGDWINKPAMPQARWAHAVVSYNTGTAPNDTAYIVLVGGGDASFANEYEVDRYNTVTGVWDTLADINSGRTQASAFYYNGRIFYIGGYGGSFSPVTTVSILDLATNTWSLGAPMLTAVGDYASGIYQDSLVYIMGGYNGATDVNTVQIYNMASDTWSSGTPMTGTAVAGARGGIAGNNIIVAGGYSQTASATQSQARRGTIDPLNPTVITWTAAANYPAGPSGRLGAVASLDLAAKRVYFTGGDPNGQGTSTLNDTYIYDFTSESWMVGPDKNMGVSNLMDLASFRVGDSVYIAALGGYNGVGVVNVQEWLTLGSTSTVLSLDLISFGASWQGNKAVVAWTAMEDGMGGKYIVERSEDGRSFSNLTTLNAGMNKGEASYKAVDSDPFTPATYYRLRIMSNDGSVSFSPVVKLSRSGNGSALEASLFPNPSSGEVNIMLQNGKGAEVAIQIIDVTGRLVQYENIVMNGTQSRSYNLKAGSYIVRVVAADGSLNQTTKLIVQ